MKKLIFTLPLLLIASCAAPLYKWSSEQGRQCFYMCQTNYYSCTASRNSAMSNNGSAGLSLLIYALSNCEEAQEKCLTPCPDLKQVKPNVEDSKNTADVGMNEVEKPKRESKLDQGSYEETQRRYANMLDVTTKSIEQNPKDADAYLVRGYVYSELGYARQAMRDYGMAIELNPNNALAFYGRGMVYQSLGSYQQALRDYKRAIELNLVDAHLYANIGGVHASLGDYQQALDNYNKAIELNSEFAEAYHNRGIIYRALGNDSMDINNLKMAAQLGYAKSQQYLNSKGIKWQ